MKVLTTILVLAVVGLTFVFYRQQSTIREQHERLEELAKQRADGSEPKPTLEYQGECAEQARKKFDYLGYKSKEFADYENHYNATLNKCFILIHNVDASKPPTIWTHKFLLDAYEGKEYGEYLWHTVKNKKYWEVPPFMCKVVLPSGGEQVCKSDDEFAELIKIYMEDGVARVPIAPLQLDPLNPPRSKLRF